MRLGLEALIAKASARRLAELAGTEKRIGPIRRRRLKSLPQARLLEQVRTRSSPNTMS